MKKERIRFLTLKIKIFIVQNKFGLDLNVDVEVDCLFYVNPKSVSVLLFNPISGP